MFLLNPHRFAPAAPAFSQVVSVTPSTPPTGTSHSINMPPSGVTAGRLLLLPIMTFTVGSSISIPLGWTRLATSFPQLSFDVFAKIAEGSEGGASVDFETSDPDVAAAQCLLIDSWSGNLADIEIAGATFATSAACNPPLLTTAFGTADWLWLALGACRNPAQTFASAPSGFSGLLSTMTAPDDYSSMASAYLQSTAASINPGAFVTSPDTTPVNVLSYTVGIR